MFDCNTKIYLYESGCLTGMKKAKADLSYKIPNEV